MSRDTIAKTTWTLTVIRDYESGTTDEIEEAKFAFGRTSTEMCDECRCRLKLPSGLVHLLQRAKLREEALETGFMIEMTGSPQKEDDWELSVFFFASDSSSSGIQSPSTSSSTAANNSSVVALYTLSMARGHDWRCRAV